MPTIQQALVYLGAVTALCTSLHALFALLALAFPSAAWLGKVSDATGTVGIWLAKIPAIFGGGGSGSGGSFAGSRKPDASGPVPPVSRRGMVFGLVTLHACLLMSCTPAQGQTVQTVSTAVFTADELACVVSQALLGTNEPTAIATFCNLSSALIPELEKVIAAQAAGARLAAAARTARDGGRQ